MQVGKIWNLANIMGTAATNNGESSDKKWETQRQIIEKAVENNGKRMNEKCERHKK